MAIEALKGKPWYVGLGIGLGAAAVIFGLGHWQLFAWATIALAASATILFTVLLLIT